MRRLGLALALVLAAPAAAQDTRDGMWLLANQPKAGIFAPEPAFNTDLAFQGNLAYQGNHEGVQVFRAGSGRWRPAGSVDCAGSPNDVAVHRGLLFTATDSSRAFPECYREGVRNFPRAATFPSDQTWEGVRIFSLADPANPVYLTAVETDCGARRITLVPDAAENRVLLYVSSSGPAANTPDCLPPHDKISVVEVPLDAPLSASVIAEPVLFPDGGFPGTPQTKATSGCNDIAVHPARDLAVGACMGEGVVMDISDRENPTVIASVTDPNVADWWSVSIDDEAGVAVFGDGLGGGTGATCRPEIGPVRGALAAYDVTVREAPSFRSYFKIPRTQGATENCVAAGGAFVPGSALTVWGWLQGGVSVVDWSNPYDPQEIAWADRGAYDETQAVVAGVSNAYAYRDHVHASEVQRGFDIYRARGVRTPRTERLNPQTVIAPR